MEYRSLVDNMAKEFYVPLLSQASHYKRAVGFFSSTVLVEIAKGILGLVNNGGKIQLIASPNLSDDDIEAIRSGYKSREEVIKNSLLRELKVPENKYQIDRLNLLANLIADGILDFRIAVTVKDSKFGMYHEKVGVITDAEGNRVVFSGSMNESANALLANYETVDVYCDWKSEDSRERASAKECAFDKIWNGIDSHVNTFLFEDISDEFIRKYRTSFIDYKDFDASDDIIPSIEKNHSFFKCPADVSLHNYQKDAIANWISNSFFGIFDMATGTGKTYTALGALCHLSELVDDALAVVIIAPYKHLVEQWVEDIEYFGVSPIIAYSYPGQNWRTEFKHAVNAYNKKVLKNFCIITTNATFASEDFQSILAGFKKNYCLVADEAHNLGAKHLSQLLPPKARYRLALSATINRFGDSEGTQALFKYFGPTCISFDVKEAITRGFLTPYYYYPILVYLDEEELAEYNNLTKQIRNKMRFHKKDEELSSALEILLIKRARIVAGCKQKVSVLLRELKKKKEQNNILIYCGATKYDISGVSDSDEIKQIEFVTSEVSRQLGMRVRKFTAEESISDRKDIKEQFINGTLQAITAIKCLDEGVNIPAIKTAYILASSINPKEYIQRRGRVLRKYPGKKYAEIFDFITLPRKLEDVRYCDEETKKSDLSLVKREFGRMLEFGCMSKRPADIEELRLKILEYYEIDETEGDFYDEQ